MSIGVVAWLLVFLYFQLVQFSGSRYAEFSLELIYPVEFPRLLRFPITQLLLPECFQIALETDFQLGWLFSYVSNLYVPLNQGNSLLEDSSFWILTLRYRQFEKTMEKNRFIHKESKNCIKNWHTWALSVIASLFARACTFLATMFFRDINLSCSGSWTTGLTTTGPLCPFAINWTCMKKKFVTQDQKIKKMYVFVIC